MAPSSPELEPLENPGRFTARIGGMGRQTSRDWVHRFNDARPVGLQDNWVREKPRRLTVAQQPALSQIVETGPDRAVDGVVCWRRIDLQRVIADRFGVACHEHTVGKLLNALGFSHVSARPRHPKQDGDIVEEKTSPARSRPTSKA